MTGTELATTSGGLELRSDQIDWLPAQRAAFEQIGIDQAPPGDQQVFLHVAKRSGLDPFARQIYMIARWDPQSGKNKWTIQTAIDGYRVIAERRSEYGGQLEPQWCGEDGVWHNVWTSKEPPVAARVGVIRKGWDNPVWGVAHFWEFAATKKDGNLNHMWSTKGRHQIAKCAESGALRKAFPQDFAGIYTEEEMEHLDNPQPAPVQIESERVPDPEPDWDSMIRAAEDAVDRDALKKVWDLAKGLRRNDSALLEKIARSGEKINGALAARAAQDAEAETPDEHPRAGDPKTEKGPQSQKNKLFALLKDGGINGLDRAVRLRIVGRILNRPPAEPVTSFDQLSAQETDAINEFLQRHKSSGDLEHTLRDLGAEGPHG